MNARPDRAGTETVAPRPRTALLQPSGLWHPGVLLAGLATTRYLAFGLRLHVVSFFPQYMSSYGVSHTQVGWLLSVFLLAYAAVLLPIGALTDRWRASPLLAFGLLLLAAGASLFALARSWPLVLMSRGVLGVGAALAYIPTMKLVATRFTPQQRGKVLGLTEAVGNLGVFTALSVFPMLSPWAGVQSLTLVLGLLALPISWIVSVAGAAAPSQSTEAAPGPPGPGSPPAARRTQQGVAALVAAMGLNLFAWTTFTAWVPTFMQERYSSGLKQVATTMGLFLVAQVLAAYPGGELSDRLGRRRPVLVVGALLAAAAGLLLLVAPGKGAVAAAALVQGVGAAWAINAGMALSMELLGTARAGLLSSLTALAGMLAGSAAGVVGGYLRDLTGSFAAIWAVSALSCIAAALLGLAVRESKLRFEQCPAPPGGE